MSTLLLAKSYFFTLCRTGGELCHRQNNADTAEPNDSAVSASLNRILFESVLIGARLKAGFLLWQQERKILRLAAREKNKKRTSTTRLRVEALGWRAEEDSNSRPSGP